MPELLWPQPLSWLRGTTFDRAKVYFVELVVDNPTAALKRDATCLNQHRIIDTA